MSVFAASLLSFLAVIVFLITGLITILFFGNYIFCFFCITMWLRDMLQCFVISQNDNEDLSLQCIFYMQP